MNLLSRSLAFSGATAVSLALLLGCGGTNPMGLAPGQPDTSTGGLALMITDAPNDAWSEVGVYVRKILAVPKGKTVAEAEWIFNGGAMGTPLNLVHLDGLSQFMGLWSAPVGTYDRLVIVVDGNPSAITLIPAPDGVTTPVQVPASQIVVNGTKDSGGWVTLPTLKLQNDLVITDGGMTGLQLDFDLSNPLFIVTHDGGAAPVYSINFQARHKPHGTLGAVTLRHSVGTITSVDDTGFGITTEQGIQHGLMPDATSGTLFYNYDSLPVAAVTSTTVPATLKAKMYVKVAFRLLASGQPVATRVWYATTRSRLNVGTPEGHIVAINATDEPPFLKVLDQSGMPVKVVVDDATAYTFQGGSDPIGVGKAFLGSLARGFKAHVTVADPTANPLVAREVDIQRAVVEGTLGAADTSRFTLSKTYWDGVQDAHVLAYNASFAWWNFAFPSLVSSDKAAFAAKVTSGTLRTRAMTSLAWDAGSLNWTARDAAFEPTTLSTRTQTITTGYQSGQMTVSYTPDGATEAQALVVHLDTAATSQPPVNEFKLSGAVVTVNALDIATWPANLKAGAKVRVLGIPRADGSLDAYMVNLFD